MLLSWLDLHFSPSIPAAQLIVFTTSTSNRTWYFPKAKLGYDYQKGKWILGRQIAQANLRRHLTLRVIQVQSQHSHDPESMVPP